MKTIKKLIAVLSAAMIFTVGLSGCNITWEEFVDSLPQYDRHANDKESGDFVYLVKVDVETEEEYVCIIGLTEAGKQKDIIVIPPVLDGYRVKQLGYRYDTYFYGSPADYFFGYFKKVYIPNTIKIFKMDMGEGLFTNYNLKEYYLNCGNEIEFLGKKCFGRYGDPADNIKKSVFLSELEYLKDREKYENVTFIKANLQYDSNIPEVTVKHFIDNVPTGSTITAPPYEPERAGYKFAGWYKESECINAWNFETDVTETIELAEGEEITEEIMQAENYATTLYAKWVII